jgi:hypothetical protein
MRMRPSFFRKDIRLLLPLHGLVLCLLLSQGPLAGLVMCFGVGGHLQVEPAHPGDSHGLPAPGPQRPCLDVPLISSLATSGGSSLPSDLSSGLQVKEPVVVTGFFHPIMFLESTSSHVFSPPGADGDTSVALLRSTILVI